MPKKFYFTRRNVEKRLFSLVAQMNTKELTSLELAVLSGGIVTLPGGGLIGNKNAVVSLSPSGLIITGYEYPLDADITIQWIKEHRIHIPEDVHGFSLVSFYDICGFRRCFFTILILYQT